MEKNGEIRPGLTPPAGPAEKPAEKTADAEAARPPDWAAHPATDLAERAARRLKD